MVYVTKEKLDELKKELEYLKTTRRQEIADRIQEAKDLGDLSENAEYAEAKDEYHYNQRKMSELEVLLNEAEVINKNTGSKKVIDIGSSFRVENSSGEQKFEMVGSQDSDPAQGKISNESPIGKAFLGKKVGDTVEINAPKGKMQFEIIEIL